MSTTDYTSLSVTNDTDKPVEVFVTFAAQNAANKCCPTPLGVGDFSFLKQIQPLRGTFTLGSKETKKFDTKGLCFSGNIGFYIEPQCPVKGANFNNGLQETSIAEFTLNPNTPCAEAFDISCVNGINCFITMKVGQDQGWYYGPDQKPIDTIYNKGLQLNAGNPGVYPVNCTDCIQLVGAPPCPSFPTGPPQTERICNVQRPGRGGILQVILSQPEIA